MNFTDTSTFDSWKQDRLPDTEASLTEIITHSTRPSHDAFANRALVRAHLRQWDVAIDDAKRVGSYFFSVPLYSFGLLKVPQNPTIRHWLRRKECRTRRRGTKEGGFASFRLGVQALLSSPWRGSSPCDQGTCFVCGALRCLLYLGGHFVHGWRAERSNIARWGPHRYSVPQLDMLCGSGTCTYAIMRQYHNKYFLQAYMHLLLGNAHMEKNNFACAIQSFEDARALMPYYVGHRVFTISLVRFLSTILRRENRHHG